MSERNLQFAEVRDKFNSTNAVVNRTSTVARGDLLSARIQLTNWLRDTKTSLLTEPVPFSLWAIAFDEGCMNVVHFVNFFCLRAGV